MNCLILVCKNYIKSTYHMVGLFLIALKIVFGLRDDPKSESILAHIASCLKKVQQNEETPVLWNTHDFNKLKDIPAHISIAESSIFRGRDSSEAMTPFEQTSKNLSAKFENSC